MTWLLFLPAGIGLGAVYGLAGVGLVILYRASGTFNFAFGAIGALGAFCAWSLINQLGFPVALGWAGGVVVSALASYLYGRVISAQLADRSRSVRAIAALGFALFLLGLISTIWGSGTPRSMRIPTDMMFANVLGMRLSYTRIGALCFAVISVIAISLLLKRTRIGLAMRAMASDRQISNIIGIPVAQTDAAAWLLSGVFAGIAGLFMSTAVTMVPNALVFMVIPAIAAAVLGGLTSMWGALLGGLVCGMAEALSTALPGMAIFRSAAPYVIAVIFVSLAGRRIIEEE